MSSNSVRLSSFLIFALVLIGFASMADAIEIINMDIEGTDAAGDPSSDNYSIRGVKIWMEGEIDEMDDENLGQLQALSSDGRMKRS